MAHSILLERGYIPITHIKRYAKPVLCFLMIFIILLSSLSVGAPAKAAIGIEDVFLTLGDLVSGAGVAAGAAGLGVTDEFEANDPITGSPFYHKSEGNKVYASTHLTTEEYFAKTITALEEIDGYYADWNAIYNVIEYQNEHRFKFGGYPFLQGLSDGKFSVPELVEMGLLKPVTLTNNNTYWVTNIGYESTGYIRDLEARKVFLQFLRSNSKKVDVIKAYFFNKIKLFNSNALSEIDKVLFDRFGTSGGKPDEYALTRVYSDSGASLGYNFYYGDLINVPNKDGTISRFTSDGIEYYHLGWIGGRFFLDNFFQIQSYGVGGTSATYGLEGLDWPLKTSDSFIGAGNQECLLRFASEYSDVYNRNAPLMLDTLDVATFNDYSTYVDERIDLYQNKSTDDVIVFAPDLYNSDGTKAQDAVYNIPVQADTVTDKIIAGEGVIDNPASGSGSEADGSIWGWLQGLWDWLTTKFWDAINAIRNAVSSIVDTLKNLWSWVCDLWDWLVGLFTSLFVPDPDYWDDKPSPASLLSSRFKIVGQLQDLVGTLDTNYGGPPESINWVWFDTGDVQTYPRFDNLRQYSVNFDYWSDNRVWIRNALSMIFRVLAVLACVRIFMGVFGVGITSAVNVTVRDSKGGGHK